MILKKEINQPWPVWLSWLEHCPMTKGLQVLFLVRAHVWMAGLIPSLGAHDPRFGRTREAAN